MRAHSFTPFAINVCSRASSLRTSRRAHSKSSLAVPMGFLPGASAQSAASMAGASAVCGGAGRAHQEGRSRFAVHTFTFVRRQPVLQPVQRLDFSTAHHMEAPMEQLHLRLLGRIDAPDIVPPAILKTVRNYREAVRLCWMLRRAKGLQVADVGRYGFTRQHVSDYLNDDDAPHRRNLPPHRIHEFEDLMGNSAISQWIARGARLTSLEEMQAAQLEQA